MIANARIHTDELPAQRREVLYITAGEIEVGDLLEMASYIPLAEVKTLDRLDPWPMSSSPHGWNAEANRWNGPVVHMGLRAVEPLPRAGDVDLFFVARFEHEPVRVWRSDKKQS